MNIVYKDQKSFTTEELERLFLANEWSSGYFPNKLAIAVSNFDTVFSAWDGDRLVGLVTVMDDGIMNAYVHYLLVDPAYDGQGIGKTMVDMVKKKYSNYMRIAKIAYDHEVDFYERCGFVKSKDSCAMYITTMWD